MKYDKKSKTMDYSDEERKHVFSSFPKSNALKKKTGKSYLDSRVKHLRKELHNERISYGELAELGKYKKHLIRTGDTELAEAAGIPEDEFTKRRK